MSDRIFGVVGMLLAIGYVFAALAIDLGLLFVRDLAFLAADSDALIVQDLTVVSRLVGRHTVGATPNPVFVGPATDLPVCARRRQYETGDDQQAANGEGSHVMSTMGCPGLLRIPKNKPCDCGVSHIFSCPGPHHTGFGRF